MSHRLQKQGSVPFGASAIKGYELATTPNVETTLWTNRWLLIAVVEVELGFGLWLLAGLWWAGSRWAVLAMFVTFFAASLSKEVAGETSCGCFGSISVSPRVSMGLDVVVISLLWLWHPAETREITPDLGWRRYIGILLLFPIIGIPGGFFLASSRPGQIKGTGEIDAKQTVILLEPEKWVGRRLPLLGFIDIGNELSDGNWLVILYRHDCSRCKELVPEYEAKAGKVAWNSTRTRTALVTVPPHGEPLGYFPLGSPSRLVKLTDAKTWFVTTPVAIKTANGTVVSVEAP